MNVRAYAMMTLLLPCVFLIGCSKAPENAVKPLFRPSPDTDVTADPKYDFSSFSGTVWKTKVKTAIAEGERYTGAPETTLLAPHRFDPTESNYSRANNKTVVTVLPVGTRVRVERLMKDNGAWGGVKVSVTVEDVTNAQKTMFLDTWMLGPNRYLMNGAPNVRSWSVDPAYLEKAKEP